MATSPLFGWSEPDDTDLVKDGAAAIRTLGNAIDTSLGDLLGGTTGQVLSKNSNTNMDFTWVDTDDANAIQNAIVDAKGDLIAATAADTPARLAVGTNGQVLTADSTAATGLAWAAASSGNLVLLNTTSFSAVSSQSVDSVFSSTYDNYVVYLYLTAATANANVGLAMRVSSTDTGMTSQMLEQFSTTITGSDNGSGGANPGYICTVNGSSPGYTSAKIDILSPNLAVRTTAYGRGQGLNSAGQPYNYIAALYTDATTQFTGYTIKASTGNITGNLKVYGVKN
jgi:hypothetical protein